MSPTLLDSTFSAIHVAYGSGTAALLRVLSAAAASTAAVAAARGENVSHRRGHRKEKPQYESVHRAEFHGTRKSKMNSGQRGNERGNENEMPGRTKGGKPSEARVPLPPPSSPSSSSSSRRGFCWRRWPEPGSLGALLTALTLGLLCVPSAGAAKGDMSSNQEPVFLEPVANVTVAMGRDALLSCVVDNLGQHQVAWIHLDREMILSIHKHVVIRQSRFHVTHDNHKTWTLHIAQVTLDDHGTYMCQVNSEKMISQVGYLKVVVPPDINDTVSSPSGIVVKEGDNVTMLCRGQGFPQPDIKWVREDGVPIKVDGGRHVMSFAGETLTLKKTSRTDMGAYLCIASNGVPPSVSKRIMLQVEFAPMMHVPNQLVAYPVTREARLECFVEAHPRAITYWEYNENMVMNNSRIRTQTYEKDYKVKMLLIIHNLSRSDMGMYKCIAKNSIGETNGSITLHVVDLITQPPNTKGAFDDYRNRDDLISKKKGHGEVNQALELDHDIRREQRLQHLDSAGNENEMERRRLEDDSRRRSQEVQRLEHDQHYTKGHVQDPPGTHHSNEASQLGHQSTSKLLVISLFLSLLLDSLRSVFCHPWTKCTRKSLL